MDLEVGMDSLELKEFKIPHLLKYMGSKREILDFVTNSIGSLKLEGGWLCDLFAGTGVVSGSLKDKYSIHANDIQAYSSVLSYTYLSNLKENVKKEALNEIKQKAEKYVAEFKAKHPNYKFDYDSVSNYKQFSKIEKDQQALISSPFDIGFHLFVKNYSGTYWSYDQCIWIDSMRAVAEEYRGRLEYYVILSSLIFAMSYVSQSTGHYAQYREASIENMDDILNYRRRDVMTYFERKFNDLIQNINGVSNTFKVTNLDYIDCLRIVQEGSVVYADPPYQSVHYSRFYHALETLVKYDYPKILHKGRYRDDRHQSPFCKKTTVKNAFSTLFEGVDSKKAHLVLSYSDTGMIKLEDIRKLAKDKFSTRYSIDILETDHIHSKMGRNDIRHQDVVEYSILFKRK
jgi:adenine-specific DNA-methyltransferase